MEMVVPVAGLGGQDLLEVPGALHEFLHHPDIQSSIAWL